MKMTLIHGEFSANDALNLITEMIHVKIRFHENKITQAINEEDLKYRENKIKRLQKELFDLREYTQLKSGTIKLEASIQIDA